MPFGDYDSSNNSMDLLGMQANKDMYEDMGANNKNSDREFKKSKTKKIVDVKKVVIVVIIVAACLAAFLPEKCIQEIIIHRSIRRAQRESKAMSMSANLPT